MKKGAAALLLFWLALSALYGGTRPSLGGDLWWSMNAGRYIYELGSVPSADVFSHAAEGEPWYNQEWLAQVFYWKCFDGLGPDGLIYVKLGLNLLFAAILAWLCMQRSGSAFLGVASSASVLLLWGYHIDLRAQFFTFLGTVTLLSTLDAYRRGVRFAGFGPPLVLLLWVDLHYGFIFGLAIVFGTFLAETTKSLLQLPADPLPIARARRLGWVFLASTVACTMNPQGIDALVFPFDILDTTSPWNQVIEWRPPRILQGRASGFVVVLALQIGVAGLAFWRVPRRFDLTDFGLVVVTAIMALTSRRFIPLFGVVGAPFFARNVATLARDVTARKSAVYELYRQRGVAAAAIVGLVGSVWVGSLFLSSYRELRAGGLFDRMTHAERFPEAAARFLTDNPIPGRIYNFYPWGGYLAYHLKRQIYVDGRAHAVYPDEIFHEVRRTDGTRAGWRKILARRRIDLVVHQSNYPVTLKLRRNPNWLRVYDDGLTAILVRRNDATAPYLDRFERGDLSYPETPGTRMFLAELQSRAGARESAIDAMVDVLETYGEPAELELVRRLELEAAIAADTSDPRAAATAAALETALERYYDTHPEAAFPSSTQ